MTEQRMGRGDAMGACSSEAGPGPAGGHLLCWLQQLTWHCSALGPDMRTLTLQITMSFFITGQVALSIHSYIRPLHSYCGEWILTTFWTVIRVSYCACLFTTNTGNKIMHNGIGHSVSLLLNIKLNPDPKMSLLLIAFSSEDSNAPFLSHTFPTFYLISSNFLFPSIK